jgi:cytochrome c oxidase cbb3-type subunit 3
VKLSDAKGIEKGESLFAQNCSACHGKDGEGGVGPNLTDEYWLHGGDVKDVFKTIKYGVPQNGMISWKAQLSPLNIQEISSYILSLKGSNPPNAKAPQGEKYEGKKEIAGK